jgi:hypothetical protein
MTVGSFMPLPAAGGGPVEFDAVTSDVETSTADPVFSVVHTASGNNRAAFAVCGTTGQGTSASMTYGGVAMTEVFRVAQSGFEITGYVLANNQIPATAQTVESTTTDFGGRHGIIVMSLKNVNQTTPAGTAATDQGTTTGDKSVTVGSVGASDMVVDAFHAQVAGGINPEADQTEVADLDFTNSQFCGGSWQLGTAGGDMSWTASGQDSWSLGAIAFKPV